MTGHLGVMFVGALGHVATTVMAGVSLIKAGLFPATGMVSRLEEFSGLNLVDPEDFTFGGWDIRRGDLFENAGNFLQSAAGLSPECVSILEPGLKSAQFNIFQGTPVNCGNAIEGLTEKKKNRNLKEIVQAIRSDITEFRSRNRLSKVIVVNLASTEPYLKKADCHEKINLLEACIQKNWQDHVRASTLYSYAAVLEGCPYLNFTPSNAGLLPAIVELAESMSVPVMGNDGKTGETLVKAALAPLFRNRNLKVLSWEGFNLLGNMDGMILNNQENRNSKIRSKESVLGNILGYHPHTTVGIEFVPSLGDQKSAWDFIHFEGFLGTRMSLQFVWQGYDSMLAAPLVLDLIRFADLASRRGEGGLMKHLASFFKAPLGVGEHNFHKQMDMLIDYASGMRPAGEAVNSGSFIQH